jgi:hypothetical protein
MKRLLLASASLLALVAAAPSASATTFGPIGNAVDFRVPATGMYEILAYGAAGGGLEPGKGAKVSGDFSINAGQVLQIAVGVEGTSEPTAAVEVVAAALSSAPTANPW